MKELKELTNLEIFFLIVAVCTLALGVGFGNVILAGVSTMTTGFALVSLLKRISKK
jgi:hypothetical protein